MKFRDIQWAGHRGCALAPENTMAAFRTAVTNGCPAIELDVQVSSDGVLCVLHDDALDRTTTGTGRLSEQPWSALQKLDAGSWFAPAFSAERIPRLDQVLDWAKNRCHVVIEVKDGERPADFANQLLQLISERQMQRDVSVISFDGRLVQDLERREPALNTGVLYAPEPAISALKHGALAGALVGALAGPVGLLAGAVLGACAGHALASLRLAGRIAETRATVDAALPHWLQLSPLVSASTREHGQDLVPYTLNHPALVAGAKLLGADAIITDHPERFVGP